MWQAVCWALAQSIKVLGIVGAWMLFKYIVSNGSTTIREIIETTGMGLQAMCFGLKRKFFELIRKEKRKEETPVTTEGTVE